MKLPSTANLATPEALLSGLHNYIDDAERLLAERNMVDLAGLDSVVDALCARVKALSLEEGRVFADKLDALNARLSQLQQQMVETQASIKAELQGTNQRQKANRAYMKDRADG
jgi:hypothetical protein